MCRPLFFLIVRLKLVFTALLTAQRPRVLFAVLERVPFVQPDYFSGGTWSACYLLLFTCEASEGAKMANSRS